jgi:hypothetical protein
MPEMRADRLQFTRELFDHSRVKRTPDSEVIPESLGLLAKGMKIFRGRFLPRAPESLAAALVGELDGLPDCFANFRSISRADIFLRRNHWQALECPLAEELAGSFLRFSGSGLHTRNLS